MLLSALLWLVLCSLASFHNCNAQSQPVKPALAVAAPTSQSLILAGEGNERAGRLAAAEADYRIALQQDSTSIPAVEHLSSVLEAEKQYTAASIYWRQALARQPDNRSFQFALATAYLDDGKNDTAAALLQQIVNQDPTFGDALINLGAALTRLDRYVEAVDVYRRAVSIQEVADSAELSLAKALITLTRFSEAKPYLDRYLARHPQSYEALYLEGTLHRSLHQMKAAESALEQSLRLDPGSFDAEYGLGSVLRDEGQYGAAIAHLRNAIALRPDAKEAHFQLARAYRAVHDIPLAEQQETILKAEEQDDSQRTQAIVLGNQAMQAFHAQDYQQAILDYRQVLTLLPKDARPRYDLALVYDRMHDRQEERRLLVEAEGLDPSLAGPHSQLGYMDLQDGQTAEAESELNLALRYEPEDVETLGNMAVLKGKLGRSDEAVHLLQLAIENDPQYQKGYLNLGLMYAAQGRYSESVAVLQKELSLNPQDAGASHALELVQLQMKTDGQPPK